MGEPEPQRPPSQRGGRGGPARVFATLERHGVDYVAIGAFAVIAHGYVCATADIDLVARQDRDNLERLATAFVELRARLRGVHAHLLDTDDGRVDYRGDVPWF